MYSRVSAENNRVAPLSIEIFDVTRASVISCNLVDVTNQSSQKLCSGEKIIPKGFESCIMHIACNWVSQGAKDKTIFRVWYRSR
jgi:hypothetical protein